MSERRRLTEALAATAGDWRLAAQRLRNLEALEDNPLVAAELAAAALRCDQHERGLMSVAARVDRGEK